MGQFYTPPASGSAFCADRYPAVFESSRQGFENKIGRTVAKALGEKLEYHWAANPRGQGGFS